MGLLCSQDSNEASDDDRSTPAADGGAHPAEGVGSANSSGSREADGAPEVVAAAEASSEDESGDVLLRDRLAVRRARQAHASGVASTAGVA
eukprot:652569-Prymnesium_polylepis.1